MGWNGTGSVTITDGVRTGTPFAQQQSGGVDPTGTLFDAAMQDLADAIEATLNRNGENKMAANLDMNTSYKIVNLATGTAVADATTVLQFQNNVGVWCGTAGGTVDAIELTITPAWSTAAFGGQLIFVPTGSNTGAVTIKVSALSPIPLLRAGVAMTAGQLKSGVPHTIIYYNSSFHLVTAY